MPDLNASEHTVQKKKKSQGLFGLSVCWYFQLLIIKHCSPDLEKILSKGEQDWPALQPECLK